MVPPTMTSSRRQEGPRARSEPEIEALVIGGSAGAVAALDRVLPSLPEDFVPVLVVVHVPASSPSLLADLFATRCAMRVEEATPGLAIVRGTIYFAPADYHFLVEPDRRCALSIAPPVYFSRPSIDVLFESAADVYGSSLAALVLTGANEDGANGLRAVHAAGGLCLVQSPPSAEVRVMPQAALSAVPSARVVALAEISEALNTPRSS